jgi:hypothetical protein
VCAYVYKHPVNMERGGHMLSPFHHKGNINLL